MNTVSQVQLLTAVVVCLGLIPLSVISLLPTTQFEDAVPLGVAVLPALVGFAWLVWRNASLQGQPALVAVLVFVIFSLRLCLAIGVGRWSWWPDAAFVFGNDWDVYESLGWDLAQSGLSVESLVRYPLNEVGIVYFVGLLYTIVGRNPLVLTVVFTFLSSWIALDVADLVTRAGGLKASGRAVFLAILIPNAILFGAMPTKDILATLAFVKIILLVAVTDARGWSVWHFLKLFGLVLVVGLVRAAMIPILLLSIGGLVLLSPKNWKRRVLFIAFVVLSGYITLAWQESELGRRRSFSPVSVSQFVYSMTGQYSAPLAEAGVVFASDEASSIMLRSYWDRQPSRVYLIPLRAAFLMFVPFPPFGFATRDLFIGSLNTLFMILLVPAAWTAVAQRSNLDGYQRQLSWLWAPLITYLLVLSAAVPFVQPRYVLPAHVLFTALAAIGFRKSRKLAYRYLALPLVFAMLVLFYTFLKRL